MTNDSPFETNLRRAWPPARWRDLTVVVGVSGGADSTALALALSRIREPGVGRLVLAHFHHGLRGAAADADARFVASLARECQLTCATGFADRAAGSFSEADLRATRLAFLQETAHAQGARYIAVAHTADDQVETILHRLLRGTGLTGLAGIPRARRLSPATTLIRPLLGINRRDVLDYLTARQQSYRTDESNQDQRYLRNRVRHKLLPLLERDFNPQVRDALRRLGDLARDARELIEHHSDQLLEHWLIAQSPDEVILRRPEATAEPASALRALLVRLWSRQNWPAQGMTAEHWERLATFWEEPARDEPRRLHLPAGLSAERSGPLLRIARPSSG